MFDFLNYTYSGIVSVLSALFGLSYPLLIECIEKIDAKYGSTSLINRFKEESIFIKFKRLIVINLIVAILFPFLMDGCKYSRYLILLQSILAILMVYKAFELFTLIMKYYNPKKLMEVIATDFRQTLGNEKKQEEAAKYFTQWSDLTTVVINSADNIMVQSVYDVWNNYINNKREKYKNKTVEYDDYFYDGITRLNETLCRNERKLLSVNNSNSLLNSLINGDAYISDKTFSILWRNLRIQLYYGREDLIMAYWKSASQKYELFLRELNESDINIETQTAYSKEEITFHNKQRKLFLEFHIMLCSMLIQEKKYALMEQMLLFSYSDPPTYPLVPSKMYDILKLFIEINASEHTEKVFYYEQQFPMPNMHGITGGKIIGAVNCYLALLVYRLYSITWYYGVDNVLSTGILPNSQIELYTYKKYLNTLKLWLEKIDKNEDLLAIINLTDFEDRIKERRKQYQFSEPLEIVENLKKRIEEAEQEAIKEQPLDEEMIKQEVDKVEKRMEKLMNTYTRFINLPVYEDDKLYNLNSSQFVTYENSAFQKDSSVTHIGIAENMIECIWRNFTHFFSSAFFLNKKDPDYKIDSGILFKALYKLLGGNREYYIICFGVYLDSYLDQVDGFEKDKNKDWEYNYKGNIVLSLYCPTKVFSQRIYIVKKEKLPKLTFKKDSEQTDGLKKVLGNYNLWMNVRKLSDISDKKIPKQIVDELGDKKDEHCAFEAYWNPMLHFPSNIEMTCLKVNYKMSDEGNWNSLDDIKPLTK